MFGRNVRHYREWYSNHQEAPRRMSRSGLVKTCLFVCGDWTYYHMKRGQREIPHPFVHGLVAKRDLTIRNATHLNYITAKPV